MFFAFLIIYTPFKERIGFLQTLVTKGIQNKSSFPLLFGSIKKRKIPFAEIQLQKMQLILSNGKISERVEIAISVSRAERGY